MRAVSPLTRTQVTELLTRHDLAPSRALGQNFVVDPNTVRRIVRLAGVGPGDHVVEVGAGLGSLTLELAAAGAHVVAIERDRHLIPALTEVLDGAAAVDIVEADALSVDWAATLAGAPSWAMVANLPYNVATPLVLDVLDGVPAVERFLVMVQREVGERLAAAPGTRAYGIPSVKVAYWATAEVVGKVSREVFLPKPKVDSVLVRLTRRPDGPATTADPGRLFELVRTGFGQRRKMLRGALAGHVASSAFDAAGVRPEARAEELTVEEWGRLTDASG
jgi:16S rRNA (adenine1518-N6/adenine1519-N6)-dimethyltransferase